MRIKGDYAWKCSYSTDEGQPGPLPALTVYFQDVHVYKEHYKEILQYDSHLINTYSFF